MPRPNSYDLMPIVPGACIPAPSDLSTSEQRRWVEVAGSLPSDWFGPGNAMLLKQYVRHAGFADELAQDIKRLRNALKTETNSKELRRAEIALRHALRSHGFQSQRLVSLATKMKLSQQSRYSRSDAAYSNASDGGAALKRPWEDY